MSPLGQRETLGVALGDLSFKYRRQTRIEGLKARVAGGQLGQTALDLGEQVGVLFSLL